MNITKISEWKKFLFISASIFPFSLGRMLVAPVKKAADLLLGVFFKRLLAECEVADLLVNDEITVYPFYFPFNKYMDKRVVVFFARVLVPDVLVVGNHHGKDLFPAIFSFFSAYDEYLGDDL